MEIVQDRLQALLELAAELGAGDQRAHVERQHALAAYAFGHLVVDDALRQAFDDRSLADAGLTDQHRVVLGAPLQHLDGAADFLVATDHRVDLAVLGALGQVDGVLLQRLALFLGIGVLHLVATAHAGDRLLDARLVGAGGFERLADLALVVERRDDEELAGDELVAALLRQLVGQHQQAVQIVADADVALVALDLRQPLHRFAELAAQTGDVDASLAQQRLGRPALLIEQGDQHMQRLDDVVVATHRQRLRVSQGLLKLGSEFVHAQELSPGTRLR